MLSRVLLIFLDRLGLKCSVAFEVTIFDSKIDNLKIYKVATYLSFI